jgi:hypothetical protein
VTRTKVHRSLRRIGFSHKAGFKIAGDSTVNQQNRPSLGFRQAVLLSSLVLDQSLFGSPMRRQPDEIKVSLFIDDIALSGSDKESLLAAYDEMRHALMLSLLSLKDRLNH